MNVIDITSLSETLDAFEQVVFYGHSLTRDQAEDLAGWIVSREGKAWSYKGLPPPTPLDFQQGARTFTGERITSGAAVAHMLGEEASRALVLLQAQQPEVRDALNVAMLSISDFHQGDCEGGFYCCGKCSASMWRFLSVSPLENAEARISNGLRLLADRRDGAGRWKTFPFYYTLLALSGIPGDLAQAELHYAAPTCERLLKRSPIQDRYGTRRHDLLERVLQKC